MSSGLVRKTFKHAVVQSLIKKINALDPTVFANYRPISKLPFLSKVLQKIVYTQLIAYLEQYNILEVFQSGFKALYNTESALLKIFNDIFFASDSRESVVRVVLDLTVPFDTVDYDILLSRLEQWVGIRDAALKWLKSYLV